METGDIAVKRVLHDLLKPDTEKVTLCLSLFYQLPRGVSRVAFVQGLVFSCDLLPGGMRVCGSCLSECLKIDSDPVIQALRDPGLLYPLIEGVEMFPSCGDFLIEYGKHKSAHHESFASDSLRILRYMQELSAVRSVSRIPYSATRSLLCRIWSQVDKSVPPHLEKNRKVLELCFRWLETSPVGTGSDRQFLLRIIKNQRTNFPTEIEYNLHLLSLFFKGLIHSTDTGFPENLQLVLPVLDQESLALCLYASLESVGIEELVYLWSLLIGSPLVEATGGGVKFSKSKFDGSAFPLFSFANVFIRISAKIGPHNWRVVFETMLRMVSGKLVEPRLIPDACELLVYLLKLEVPGRTLPSLLLAGGNKDMIPVVENILAFAETVFNRMTVLNPSDNLFRNQTTARQLEFLSALIRTLQEDLAVVKSGHTHHVPTMSSLLHLPTAPLEFARLQSIGIQPSLSTASVLPPDTAALMQPVPPLQGVVMANQVYVPPVAVTNGTTAMTMFPTGQQGVDIGFRSDDSFAGIQNFNNTCYLSSFLQLLFLTDGFLAFVYGFGLEKLAKTEEADFVQGAKIISGLQLLFARLLKTHHEYIEIAEFIRALPPSYRSGEQQDVTESGRWMFDKMGGTDQVFVRSIFGGEMIHKTQCSGCNNITERKEVFTDLCVSVPKQAEVLGKRKVTVQSLIKKMLKPETLSGDNKYSCDTCNKKQNASRWIELTQLPNHLMLVMHKFSFDIATCDFKKETTPVLPEDGSIDLIGTRYELYGSILHYGESAMKGHYVALGKRSSRSGDHSTKWALLDDSHVSMLSEAEAMERLSGLHKPTDSAYVLFYKSTQAPPAPNPRIPQPVVDEALAIEAAAVHL